MKELQRRNIEATDGLERELLGSWKASGPTGARRDASWEKLAAGVAGAAAVVAVTHTTTAITAGKGAALSAVGAPLMPSVVAPTVVAATSTVKWLILGTLAAAAVGAVSVVVQPPTRTAAPSPAASVALASPVSVVAAPAMPLSPPPPVVPAPTPSASPVVRATTPPVGPIPIAAAPAVASTPDLSIAKQVAALDEARGALSAGDAPRALRVLDDYDARYPEAVRALSEEATVVRVKALLLAGRAGDARAVGRRFVEQYPSSPYAGQVHAALGDPN